MKNALVIAAPFGFGPASKAIHIARTLAPSLSVTMVSAGDAHRFVTRHAPAGTVCRAGTLAAVFSVQDLAAFDLIVCVDNAPAARYLSRSGLGDRVVFVDDLLQWRVGLDELQNDQPIRAYLVQDFPGAGQHLSACNARQVELVAPVVWGSGRAPVPAAERAGLTLCIGGGTSPLVSWGHIRHLVARLIKAAWQVSRRYRTPLYVIGNDHMAEFAAAAPRHLNILGSVSPDRSSELIGSSRLLITTPGIGASYEAIQAATPLLLLPPMNSTQLQQFRVFRQQGMAHVLDGDPVLDELLQLERLPWTRHAQGCIAWMDRAQDSVARDVQAQALALCESPRPEAVTQLLQRQQALFQGLSQLDIRQPLLTLAAGART